jgi:hypothetical protein
MGMNLRAFMMAGLCLLPMPVLAQQADCPAGAPLLPSELSGWATRTPLTASTDKTGLKAAQLEIGKGADATLKPTPDVQYLVRPEKPGGSVSYGGLFGLTVTQAGTYRIALGSAAWIDMLAGKKTVASTSHGHGPACSGIRKMVDFPLKPGRYTIQIAGNGALDLALMIVKLP